MMQLPVEECHRKKGHWEKSHARETPERAFRLTPSALSPRVVAVHRSPCPVRKRALFLFGSVSPFANGPHVSNLHSERAIPASSLEDLQILKLEGSC